MQGEPIHESFNWTADEGENLMHRESLKDMPGNLHSYSIRAVNITRILFSCIAIFYLIDILLIFLRLHLGLYAKITVAVSTYFDLNGDNNVPLFFSSVLLFTASCITYLLACASGKRNWMLLSFFLLFLTIDEFTNMHRHLSKIVQKLVINHHPGFFAWDIYGWVVPFGAMLLIAFIFFHQLFRKMEAARRKLFSRAVWVYLAGMIVFEVLKGRVDFVMGDQSFLYLFISGTGSILKMCGIVLFLHALFMYMIRENFHIRLVNKL